MMSMSVTTNRPTMREREREQRRRRAARLAAMRSTVAALETALPVIVTLDDNDDGSGDDSVLWEDLLDPEALRVRQLMRKSISLTKEVQNLTSAQNQLKLLLREHHVASMVLTGMIARSPVDDWKDDVERWRSIVRKHYRPWTMSQCQKAMRAALHEVESFKWSSDKQSTGVSFLGWRDSRRVDQQRGVFQFQFEKTMRGYDMTDHVKVTWNSYAHAKPYYDVIIGPHARVVDDVAIGQHVRAVHEDVQKLGHGIKMVRIAEQYPDTGIDVHIVYLVFRVKTERGYIQCVRSVSCPELVKAINEPRAVWPSNSIWLVFERLEGDDQAYNLRIGGSLIGNDVNYLSQWMFEALGCVLRSERAVTGRQLLTRD